MKIKLNKLIIIIVLIVIVVAVLGVICANLKSNRFLTDNKQNTNNITDTKISLYEYIQQNSVYSSQYLNKMNSTKSDSLSLNVVDTETMTFKISIESFYDYFLRYVFQNRVEGANTSKVDLAKEKNL